MFRFTPKGRVKGQAWMFATIVGIYADYTIQAHHMSRDGVVGQYATFAAFVHRWHLAKYGLRHVAEAALADLVVTVRENTGSHKAQVFGELTGILPGAQARGTLEHLDFYVFALRALAGRKPVQTLFSGDDLDELPTVCHMPQIASVLRE